MGDYDNLNTFFDPNSFGNTAITNIFSQYPLINSNASNAEGIIVSYRGDGVDPTEILNYMFKKQFGIPNASPYSTYSTESVAQSSFQNSTTDRQFSQYIPFQCPTDIYEDTDFRNNIVFNGILVDDSPDYNQARYISSNYPYLAFYSNVIMLSIVSGSQLAFYVQDENYNILTQNAISLFYSQKNTKIYGELNVDANGNILSYQNQIKLTDITGNNNLQFGYKLAGSWLFDTDSGIVTFYDDVDQSVATVNADNPPRISFWRYEGLIGNNTIMNVADF